MSCFVLFAAVPAREKPGCDVTAVYSRSGRKTINYLLTGAMSREN
jgi:hypothetical protein